MIISYIQEVKEQERQRKLQESKDKSQQLLNQHATETGL
jgi:hypothetical protein